jgi:hypothetical protein
VIGGMPLRHISPMCPIGPICCPLTTAFSRRNPTSHFSQFPTQPLKLETLSQQFIRSDARGVAMRHRHNHDFVRFTEVGQGQ